AVTKQPIRLTRQPKPPVALPANTCLSGPECQTPIPGSASEFSERDDQKQAQNLKEQAANPKKAAAAGKVRPAVELVKFANKEAPGLLDVVAGVFVNPALTGAEAG